MCKPRLAADAACIRSLLHLFLAGNLKTYGEHTVLAYMPRQPRRHVTGHGLDDLFDALKVVTLGVQHLHKSLVPHLSTFKARKAAWGVCQWNLYCLRLVKIDEIQGKDEKSRRRQGGLDVRYFPTIELHALVLGYLPGVVTSYTVV